MARKQIEFNNSGIEVKGSSTGTATPLADIVADTTINFNTRVLCKLAIYFGITEEANLSEYEGRKFVTSTLGEEVNNWLESL